MRRLLLNQSTAALRRIRFPLLQEVDDYTPITGAAASFVAADIQVSKNGGTETDSAGTVSEIGGGEYYYEATAAELNTEGFLVLRMVYSGARRKTIEVEVKSYVEEAAALLDLAAGVETSRTVREALRLILSACVGKSSGADVLAPVFRDSNDSKNRITATSDLYGNRLTVTLDDT